jgi:hypothetical protein
MQTAITTMRERGEYDKGMNVTKAHIKEAYRCMKEEGQIIITRDTDSTPPPFSNSRILKRKHDDFECNHKAELYDQELIDMIFKKSQDCDWRIVENVEDSQS